MKDVENFLTTDYIYFPLKKGSKLFINDGEYIYKNDKLIEYNNKIIYSSVSGKVLGMTNIDNNKYVVIENDYKDKTKKRTTSKKDITNYTKEELYNLINTYNIIDNFDMTSKVLIINCIDEYSDEITYNTILKKYTINILDTIDALIDIMDIKKCFFAVSNSDSELINILLNNMGTYPKIDLKLFKNDNIIGKKEILIDRLTKYRNKKYNIQYLNIKDILNIFNLLKKHIPITTTYITLTGDLINYTKVIKVNIGTNLLDILNEYNIKEYKNIIINGLLNGNIIKNPNYIINNNIRSIFINTIKKYECVECINCGKCVFICPININPKHMYFNKDKKSNIYKKKCINCGMCSYICPSKLELNKGCDKNE